MMLEQEMKIAELESQLKIAKSELLRFRKLSCRLLGKRLKQVDFSG